MPGVQKGGKKGRKIGRNKIKCARYRQENRLERNKARKMVRHLKENPNDGAARKVFDDRYKRYASAN